MWVTNIPTMKSSYLLRVASLLLGLSWFSIPLQAQPERRGVGLANPEEPLVLRGLRGGSQMIGATEIRISDCVLDSLNIASCQRLTIEGSVIHRYANLLADQSLTVRDCEFYGSVTWDSRGGSALFTHNIFTQPLFLHAASADFPRPTITGNSFLGQFQAVEVQDFSGSWTEFANLKLPLAGNYWGSSEGPRYPGQAGPEEWLGSQGAFCQHWDGRESYLYLGFETAAGDISDAYRPRPQVWVQAARAGQNVLESTLGRSADVLARPGRELLVCFDLKSSVRRYAPRFTLLCDDQELAPEGTDVFTVQRSYLPITESPANRERTLNFIIPASRVTGRQLELKLKMDTREIGGYATPGGEQVIWTANLTLKPLFKRRLRIGVMPVSLRVPFWITAEAKPEKTRQRLEGELPALWPLLPEEFDVLPLPTISVNRGYFRGAAQALTGGNLMTLMVSRAAAAYLNSWNASRPQEQWLDRVVCVVPNGSLASLWGLSQNEGATLGITSSIVLVEENKPAAALHELGHSLGLYLGFRNEQYNYTTTDGLGNPIAQVDMGGGQREWNGAMVRNAVMFNDTGFTDSDLSLPKILHVPLEPTVNYFDFMGASTPNWVIPTSLEAVYRGLASLLGTKPAPGLQSDQDAPEPAGRPALMGPPPAGHRRVVFTGALRRYQDRDTLAYSYRVYPDTVRVRDVSGEDFNLTEGNRATMQYVECFDAGGQLVAPRIPIVASLPDPAVPPVDPVWLQVVDLPIATARLAITDRELQGFEFLSLLDDGMAFQAQLGATPAAGALTGTITLNLGHSAGARTVPVFYQPYYSADGQTTWVPIGEMTTETTVTLDARDLPATDNLSFRLVAADAFRSARAELTGFRVANRAPVVQIESPHTGDAAGSDATWLLAAKVFDLEDGLIRTGEWRSSRDGLLGTNAVLPEIHLSAGEHVLTFSVTDQQGAPGAASAQVRSGPVADVDLVVGDDALRVSVAGVDPTVTLPNRLQTDRLNQIRVTVRNGGLTNEARLSLFLTLEDSAEQLLASQIITNWAPFALGSIETAYVYPGANRYTLRAVVTDALVLDPNPTNNSRSWSFDNEPPVPAPARFDVTPQAPLDFLLSGFDPDGDPLDYRLVTGPARGVLERLGETWRYRPLNAGQDSLTFTVSDGRFESAPAAVTFFTTTAAAPVPVPPSIVSADRVFATVGQDFTHAVVVTAPPANFAAYGLPDGLQINLSTGLIFGRPTQSGEFAVFVEAVKAGATSTQEIKLRVQDTFARWIASFGLTGADAAPEVDWEGDSYSNLQEYAHQMNPKVHDADGGLSPLLIREPLGLFRELDYFVVTYRQRIGGVGNPAVDYAVDGVRYRLEYNDTLDGEIAWAGGDRIFEVLESRRVDNGDGTEWISVKCQIPVTDTTQGYVRLRVTPP